MIPPISAEEARRLMSKHGMTSKVKPLTKEEINRIHNKKQNQSYRSKMKRRSLEILP